MNYLESISWMELAGFGLLTFSAGMWVGTSLMLWAGNRDQRQLLSQLDNCMVPREALKGKQS